MSDYTQYYRSNLEDALEFQDWISDQLRKATPALIIGPYSSRKYQLDKGESFSGIEIKNDKKLAEFHNLYFEVAEKSHPDRPSFTPSGVMRQDNGWLFLIGDYNEVFLFCTNQLRRLYEHSDWHNAHKVTVRRTPTSIGFTMPRQYVLSGECPYLLKHWVFNEEEIKRLHPGQTIF